MFNITWTGRSSEQIFKSFNHYVATTREGVDGFCLRFNAVRKAADTFSHLAGSPGVKAEATKDTVTAFLLHSGPIRNLHYRYHSPSAVVSDFRVFSSVLAVLAALEMLRDDDDDEAGDAGLGASLPPANLSGMSLVLNIAI